MTDSVVKLLETRGVRIEEMAELVYELQKPYHANLELDECEESVRRVLGKREVQHALYTGIALDMLAEEKSLPDPLQQIMEQDEPLYGVDEILALSVTNIYGSIAMTNFGYLDKEKSGVIGRLNNASGSIHVFLDDLVSSVVASAAARIAHHRRAKSYADPAGD